MHEISIYSSRLKKVKIEQDKLQKLIDHWQIIMSTYELYLQYSLVCSSLANFKKLMYARAIDLHEMPVEQQFVTSSSFIEAENSTMHMVSSLLKFTDLLPSIYSKCFPEKLDVYAETTTAISSIYNESNRKYMFLYELRNAIVHNKVLITVSHGGSKKLISPHSCIQIGYYIDFEKFCGKHVTKKHKLAKLLEAKNELCDEKGRVDLALIFTEVISDLYRKLVVPMLKELEQQINFYSSETIKYLVNSEFIKESELSLLNVECENRLIYSTSVLGRVHELKKSISYPINGLCILIAPSTIK
ncbi:hypothetical protein [Rheinheimera sp.]|uniref:hypothetical protein n=1 Tax=Rheinheimera sp. TaxID=1869214 RepID=UPI0027354898|nr:hypothetical protein [Rheinheimera sp.]MDP2715225.1 hypothetical protein [Rheinheimera sp.]